jgi:CotH kinase protein
VRFASTAGVRIHGGGSRVTSPRQGYRVYLRREYEAAPIPPGLMFDVPHAHPVRVLMVHNDVRVRQGVRWALTNPLAYDIAARVGAITTPSRPVRFFLNGEFQGVYVLYEHFHPNHYFRAHGQRAIRLDGDEFEALATRIRALAPVTMAIAGEIVDVENLTRWFVAVAFCATRDPFQGPSQFRDASRTRAQWFWVNWDMDASFGNARNNPFDELLLPPGGGRRGRRDDEIRPYLMTALLAQDPAYREYFKAAWIQAMNYEITPAFLRERFEHYHKIARTYGVETVEYLPLLAAFLAERPGVLRGHAGQYLQTPTVSFRLTTVRPVLVDGHEVSGPFEGYYFHGMGVTLDVPSSEGERFSHWRVNGSPHPRRQTTVTLNADRDLSIQAIWR